MELSELGIELMQANERLYALAHAQGLVNRHKARPAVRPLIAKSGARVVYETTRDLTFDAVRITLVSLMVNIGAVELAPIAAGASAFLVATVLRVVIVKLGGEE